jgi:hypothetical protein
MVPLRADCDQLIVNSPNLLHMRRLQAPRMLKLFLNLGCVYCVATTGGVSLSLLSNFGLS